MRKDSITTYGEDTTDMTPGQAEALAAEEVSPEEVDFFQRLRASERRLLERPDYSEANAAMNQRRVA